MQKDMQIASQIALSHYLDLGVTAAVRDQLLEQVQWGYAEDDYSSSRANICRSGCGILSAANGRARWRASSGPAITDSASWRRKELNRKTQAAQIRSSLYSVLGQQPAEARMKRLNYDVGF